MKSMLLYEMSISSGLTFSFEEVLNLTNYHLQGDIKVLNINYDEEYHWS